MLNVSSEITLSLDEYAIYMGITDVEKNIGQASIYICMYKNMYDIGTYVSILENWSCKTTIKTTRLQMYPYCYEHFKNLFKSKKL
jgi:hypothetical protein